MTGRKGWFGVLAVLAAAAVFAAACGDGSPGTFAGRQMGDWQWSSPDTAPASTTSTTTTTPQPGDASFAVQGSVNQVAVTDTDAFSKLDLVAADGHTAANGTSDSDGSFIFRNVRAAHGYRVVDSATKKKSNAIDVMDVGHSTPPQSFYSDQKLVKGFQYITTRDGTKLSTSVYLPDGPGPYPTVVEYSGYDPSNPTADGGLPAQPMSIVASQMGYAVVAVNIRGTGCSGGAFDFFEPLQLLDGYDVIETAAAQSWVKGGKVGMVGLSYPGITQLFVASTQPPHLAAITPLSVYDDTARGVLAPGGFFNKGFALSWAANVLDEAKPLGQGWEHKVIEAGDKTCGPNQMLRGQNVDPVAKAKSTDYYDHKLADPVNPTLFAHKIDVPVFMTGAWQDEQTGPRFVNLWNKLTNAPVKKFFGFNGAHADGASPETLVEWKAFLDFYVAGTRTPIPAGFRALAPAFLAQVFGAAPTMPPDRLVDGSFADLKKEYESEPEITILWDRGGNPANPGSPESTGRTTFTSWPPPGTKAWRSYFGPGGTLGADKPTGADSASRWTADPALADKVTLPGGSEEQAFDAKPPYQWDRDLAGDAAVFVSDPMPRDTVVLGSGSADLWVRSSGTTADLGVTISEVRPDGTESYLQSGFLRADLRKPGKHATALDPDQSALKSDASPLTPGKWTLARVQLLPVGAVLRKGSRLRISVHTPGGDKPRWSWIVDPNAKPTIDIGHDAAHPSSLVLPVVDGVTGYSEQVPPCPSLRGQPCRLYVPYTNTPAPN